MGCGQEKNEACSDDERSTSRTRFSDAGDDDNIERVLSGRELGALSCDSADVNRAWEKGFWGGIGEGRREREGRTGETC